jgi:hypothetical protein
LESGQLTDSKGYGTNRLLAIPDFAGARRVLAENSRMIRRAIFALMGLVALGQPLNARPPEQLLLDGDTFGRQEPWVSLENRDRFFFSSAFGSMRATQEILPSFDPSEPLNMAYLPSSDSKDSLDRIIELEAQSKIRFGGEVGFLYGKSTGKYGREDFAGYIMGTVGNEYFSINVGYLHQESTFNVPRRRR